MKSKLTQNNKKCSEFVHNNTKPLFSIARHFYAQALRSLPLLTQGNIYSRLRFLNKYLIFFEELNELFREN